MTYVFFSVAEECERSPARIMSHHDVARMGGEKIRDVHPALVIVPYGDIDRIYSVNRQPNFRFHCPISSRLLFIDVGAAGRSPGLSPGREG